MSVGLPPAIPAEPSLACERITTAGTVSDPRCSPERGDDGRAQQGGAPHGRMGDGDGQIGPNPTGSA